jgi:hypothetical protein
MFIKGKTGEATGIGLEYFKALLKSRAQVSCIVWLNCHVREVVDTRLHSHDSIRRSGYFVIKQTCYLLRRYGNETPQFVTDIVHGSTLHFRIIIANCCNISHSRFLQSHFIFRHKQNINVFKMLFVKSEEIWRFDIREFSIKMNQGTVNWICVAHSRVLWI